MRAFAGAVLIAALSGCGTTSPDQTSFADLMRGEGVQTMILPDGRTGYLVNCDAGGFSRCYDRSRQICGGDFTVLARTDRFGADEDERRIEITCKAP